MVIGIRGSGEMEKRVGKGFEHMLTRDHTTAESIIGKASGNGQMVNYTMVTGVRVENLMVKAHGTFQAAQPTLGFGKKERDMGMERSNGTSMRYMTGSGSMTRRKDRE